MMSQTGWEQQKDRILWPRLLEESSTMVVISLGMRRYD